MSDDDGKREQMKQALLRRMGLIESTPKNYWVWISPNNVSHAVGQDGRCYTCGKSHEKEDT